MPGQHQSLLADFLHIRSQTVALCAPLENEDYGVQSMPDASPVKWHLAHTSWFFEEMILKPFAKDYAPYNDTFTHLFNSYYESIGCFFTRSERGLISRPTVKEVYAYRLYIDTAVEKLLSEKNTQNSTKIHQRLTLGLHHEQQHQELLLTDIKHAFSKNPLRPVYMDTPFQPSSKAPPVTWIEYKEGLYEVGYQGEDFSYDNECPSHKSYVTAFKIASRPVTNEEYLSFIDDGGYQKADLWLSDAWTLLKAEKWEAPLYWEKQSDGWWFFTLQGMRHINMSAPVCHVSFYEAAAYARWAKKRLPTESEWEVAATTFPIIGNLADTGMYAPSANTNNSHQFYGDVWEWTSSPYTEYPGYQRLEGPLGEYNGKFMSSQMVLRGGSCLTPKDHIRPSYRNFFYPDKRWQYSGIRLAEDL